jgi:hypothetical protein
LCRFSARVPKPSSPTSELLGIVDVERNLGGLPVQVVVHSSGGDLHIGLSVGGKFLPIEMDVFETALGSRC